MISVHAIDESGPDKYACLSITGTTENTQAFSSIGRLSFLSSDNNELSLQNMALRDITMTSVPHKTFSFNITKNQFTHTTNPKDSITVKASHEFSTWNTRLDSIEKVDAAIKNQYHDQDPEEEPKRVVYVIDKPPELELESVRAHLKQRLCERRTMEHMTIICLMDDEKTLAFHKNEYSTAIHNANTLFDLSDEEIRQFFCIKPCPVPVDTFPTLLSTLLGSFQSSATRLRIGETVETQLPVTFCVPPSFLKFVAWSSNILSNPPPSIGHNSGTVEFSASGKWTITLIGSFTDSDVWDPALVKFDDMCRDIHRLRWLKNTTLSTLLDPNDKTYFHFAHELMHMEADVGSLFKQHSNTKRIWNDCNARVNKRWKPISYDLYPPLLPARGHSAVPNVPRIFEE
mgnify:CR=1 FL=1